MTTDEPGGEFRVEVDRVGCEGHALCVVYAPGVFEVDDEERAVVIRDPVPAHLRGAVAEAAGQCPVQAISLHQASR